MKNKYLAFTILLIVFSFISGPCVLAQNDNIKKNVQNQNQEQTQTKNKGEENQVQNQTNAEQHRSSVANSVQNILQVADREGGIGEEIRLIAQEQNKSVDSTVNAIEKIENRNKIKTFLIGTDYKNLGTLRSEIVKTTNRLEKLNKLVENVENEEDKTELQNQIKTLEEEKEKIENFVKDNESKFSLFGWFVKLFNR